MVQIGSRNTLSSVVSSAFQLSDDAEEISLLWASWQRVQNTTHTSHADQDQTESKETKTKEREL
jgi:hypothetical protein